jgi:hypothetical protein
MLPQGVNMQMLPKTINQALHNTLTKIIFPSKPSVHAFIFEGLLAPMQGLVAKEHKTDHHFPIHWK